MNKLSIVLAASLGLALSTTTSFAGDAEGVRMIEGGYTSQMVRVNGIVQKVPTGGWYATGHSHGSHVHHHGHYSDGYMRISVSDVDRSGYGYGYRTSSTSSILYLGN